jgi:transcriptional regulator with XRE-family HTH domain
MNHTNKLQPTIDPIAEARKDKKFAFHSKSARVAVRLAVEIYAKRKQRGWNQIELAKNIGTTQKVISNIENGDVNIGVDLLKRLVDGLGLSNDDLGNIFESCICFPTFQNNSANAESTFGLHYKQTKYSTANNYVKICRTPMLNISGLYCAKNLP